MDINTDALKKLSDMKIDSQYAEQIGIKLFNSDQTSADFQILCVKLRKLCDDLQGDIEALRRHIPVQ